ncbi:hypothetical protein COS70_02565 [Candidatus Micrarchaeota archaeon CG06_land_8_20_14_3_00_50_6]|nr:MAG: hypothetical protein COS70_02565 [Candidatus Micrarchaeota archaeon CG06_land_8_20_14_3_00_50_6]
MSAFQVANSSNRRGIILGISGAGTRGQGNLATAINNIASDPELPFFFDPVGVYTPGGNGARTLKTRFFPQATVFEGPRGYEQMMKTSLRRENEIAAVIIASPNQCHEEQTKTAMKGGIDGVSGIYVDKPIALLDTGVQGVSEAIRETRFSGVIVVGLPFRLDPTIQGLGEMLVDEVLDIGDVVSISHRGTLNLVKEGEEAGNWKCGYGMGDPISMFGIHLVDMQIELMAQLGNTLTISPGGIVIGKTWRHNNSRFTLDTGVDARIQYYDYTNKTTPAGELHVDVDAPEFSLNWEIIGNRGSLKMNQNRDGKSIQFTGRAGEHELTEEEIAKHAPDYCKTHGHAATRELLDWGTAITQFGEYHPAASFYKVMRNEWVGHAIMLSARSGEEIRLG